MNDKNKKLSVQAMLSVLLIIACAIFGYDLNYKM